jgi:hypothetical protein
MYFQNFPLRAYDINGDSVSVTLLVDILERVKIRDQIKNQAQLFLDYSIQEGETPEIIAGKLYNDPELYWGVLLGNNIINPYGEWPLDSVTLFEACTDKYGAGNEFKIHHYIDAIGLIVLSSAPGATSVSNYQYEDQLNETKRSIKLIIPTLIGQVQQELTKLLKG